MDDGNSTILLAILVLVALSAFFSASETAFSSLNRVRLKVRADDGDVRAARAVKLIDRYDDLLSAILIGNNIVNIASASLATVFFTRLFQDNGPTISTAVMTAIVLIFGEVTPKSLAKEMPEDCAVMVAPVIHALMMVFSPLNALFRAWKRLLQKLFHLKNVDTITEDELISIVSEAHNDGTLNESESELIRSAIEFDDLEVESILTPRVDMEAVEDTVSMKELADRFEESGFSRIPVYHESIDNVIGVVLEKDFFPSYVEGTANLEHLITEVEYTTGHTKISELLHQLQKNQNHMAIVIDEFGGTQGLVTLEDILEELVGEIWDEHDEAVDDCREQADHSWLVSGSMSMEDFAADFPISDEMVEEYTTVGGWALAQIGRLPREGQHFEQGRLTMDVVKVFSRRIHQLRIKVLPEKKEENCDET